jgi:hypothetical protein
MSEEGEMVAWLRQLADGIRTDPELPPGVIVLESGTGQVAGTVSFAGGTATGEMREDLRSFHESFPYNIRLSERGEPILCESCGALVALTPETRDTRALLGADARWTPGIWEFGSLRRHTMRRCEWKRANP